MKRPSLVQIAGLLAAALLGGGGAAMAQTAAELGSCAAYSGLPSEVGETAGMTFAAGGTFAMGSDQHQPEESFTHVTRGRWVLDRSS